MSSLTNKCPYGYCRRNYKTLNDLIIHIENVHLDFSAATQERLENEKPESIPMSYVLRFGQPGQIAEEAEYVIDADRPIILETIPNSIIANAAFSNHSIFKRRKQICSSNADKPFACSLPGCKKTYKNINGIKYHYINHHNKTYNTNRNDMVAKPKKSTARKVSQKIKIEPVIDFHGNINQFQDPNLHTSALPFLSDQVALVSSPNLNFLNALEVDDEQLTAL